MKKLLVFITILSLAVPNITAADENKKSSSWGWKTAAAVSTAVIGTLVLVTGGTVAYEEYKKDQAGKKALSESQELASKELNARLEKQKNAEKKNPDFEENGVKLSNAVTDKLQSARSSYVVGGPSSSSDINEEYIRMSSLIFSLLLKYSSTARADATDVLNIVRKKKDYTSMETAVHLSL